MLAVQLAHQSSKPIHITLYDADGQFARGVAYSTKDRSHLLNVRADRMGAFEDRPDDFYHWLLAYEFQWRANHPELQSLIVLPEAFMPRLLYGDYIAHLLEAANQNANGVTIERIKTEVTDADTTNEGIVMTLKDGSRHNATYMVLALGSLPTAQHGVTEAILRNSRYTSVMWLPPIGSILSQIGLQNETGPIVIIGTGLTTIDAIVSLRGKGYSGKIIAVSRHGLLPEPHQPSVAPYPPFLFPTKAPTTALGIVRVIRHEIRDAKEKNIDWRSVIDALRADTPALWAQLSEKERKKALRLLSFWNVHRHRMPPSSAALIAREIAENKLVIVAGSLKKIEETKEGLSVKIRGRGGNMQTFDAAHVINCSGPQMNIAASDNPLLLHLLKSWTITSGPLQLGLAADDNGRVKGNAPARIYALGPLLVGERLETVAVPELRKQAGELARTLLATL